MQLICICYILTIMKGVLQNYGLKVTSARMLLLQTLKQLSRPVTIASLLQNDHIAKSMNKTTLYRSLEKMAEQGIIYKTYFNGESAHYEWQESHHHHITCNECGYREPVSTCLIKNYQPKSASKFATVTNHVVELFGTCQSCIV